VILPPGQAHLDEGAGDVLVGPSAVRCRGEPGGEVEVLVEVRWAVCGGGGWWWEMRLWWRSGVRRVCGVWE
jgi:hypothetical protein